mgnify:CR=1 FL=1
MVLVGQLSGPVVEVGLAAGVPSHLIEDEEMIDERWLDDVETVGLTSGASAPEALVARVCEWFRRRGVTEIASMPKATVENVFFRLPLELRHAISATGTA